MKILIIICLLMAGFVCADSVYTTQAKKGNLYVYDIKNEQFKGVLIRGKFFVNDQHMWFTGILYKGGTDFNGNKELKGPMSMDIVNSAGNLVESNDIGTVVFTVSGNRALLKYVLYFNNMELIFTKISD